MNVFFLYLKDRKFFLGIWFVNFLLCATVFSLYHFEREAILYAFLISSIFVLLCMTVDFYRYRKHHRMLQEMQKSSYIDLAKNDKSSLFERDYQQILASLKAGQEAYISQVEKEKIDLEDYFTMWVHQAKLPIAAMKLLLEDEHLSKKELQFQLLRMDQYTDMVLAYLRLNSTNTDFLFKELELDDLIRQSIRHFSSEFIRKHIKLDFKETHDRILSDEKWLVFVIEQILSNALKYTPEQGTITITMSEKHLLVIEDTGIGINAGDLYRVFEKGYTGLNGRMDKTASGLGLYLCKNILDSLNHKITIESTVGKGTRVCLNLTHFEGRIE